MVRFSKTIKFVVKYRVLAGLKGCLHGLALSTVAHLPNIGAARRIQQQKAEARLEADKKDDELRQKWAGNVGPDYWK